MFNCIAACTHVHAFLQKRKKRRKVNGSWENLGSVTRGKKNGETAFECITRNIAGSVDVFSGWFLRLLLDLFEIEISNVIFVIGCWIEYKCIIYRMVHVTFSVWNFNFIMYYRKNVNRKISNLKYITVYTVICKISCWFINRLWSLIQ